jgi:hypothetical protein
MINNGATDSEKQLFSVESIEAALDNLAAAGALEKYRRIMDMVHNDAVDVSGSHEFQKLYNDFYVVRSRERKWYSVYYSFMQNRKNTSLSFCDVLVFLFENTGSGTVESSFSSKLLHTLLPETFPTWDRCIGANTDIVIPDAVELPDPQARIKTAVRRYDSLTVWFNKYKVSENGQDMLRRFDRRFPGSSISDIKKIDLVLWQIR